MPSLAFKVLQCAALVALAVGVGSAVTLGTGLTEMCGDTVALTWQRFDSTTLHMVVDTSICRFTAEPQYLRAALLCIISV